MCFLKIISFGLNETTVLRMFACVNLAIYGNNIWFNFSKPIREGVIEWKIFMIVRISY